MTIKELIIKLRNYPEEMRVIIEGYEGGFNDISSIKEKTIAVDVNKEWYLGQHIDSDDEYMMEKADHPVIEKALLFAGKNNLSEI